MTTKELQNSLLVALETAKTLTEILNSTIEGAHTLEKMCEGIEAGTDEFADTIAAASLHLMDAAKVLAEATYKATPSNNYV